MKVKAEVEVRKSLGSRNLGKACETMFCEGEAEIAVDGVEQPVPHFRGADASLRADIVEVGRGTAAALPVPPVENIAVLANSEFRRPADA